MSLGMSCYNFILGAQYSYVGTALRTKRAQTYAGTIRSREGCTQLENGVITEDVICHNGEWAPTHRARKTSYVQSRLARQSRGGTNFAGEHRRNDR
eukprot:1190337-Prorocentrum_minimum.AAC.1